MSVFMYLYGIMWADTNKHVCMYVCKPYRVTGHVKTVTYGIIYHKVGGLVCRQRDK